jgi:hypothetical protein
MSRKSMEILDIGKDFFSNYSSLANKRKDE